PRAPLPPAPARAAGPLRLPAPHPRAPPLLHRGGVLPRRAARPGLRAVSAPARARLPADHRRSLRLALSSPGLTRCRLPGGGHGGFLLLRLRGHPPGPPPGRALPAALGMAPMARAPSPPAPSQLADGQLQLQRRLPDLRLAVRHSGRARRRGPDLTARS